MVNIASLNIKSGLSDAKAKQDVQDVIANGADVIGLQEIGDQSRENAIKSVPGFSGHHPSGEASATPIIWRTGMFEVLDRGVKKVSDRTYVGEPGAGPDTLKSKYVVWVKLRHKKTKKVIIVANGHAVASVEDNGRYKTGAQWQDRVELHKEHMTGLRDFIEEKTNQGLVFVTGDFNFNFRADSREQTAPALYARMNSIGVRASYRHLGLPSSGTHKDGTRLIDYVHYQHAKAVRPRVQRVIKNLRTDHNALLVAFDFTDVSGYTASLKDPSKGEPGSPDKPAPRPVPSTSPDRQGASNSTKRFAGLNPMNGLEQIIVYGDKFKKAQRDMCLSANVDLSMTQTSQFTFEFADEDFKIFNEGTFQPNVSVLLGKFEMTVSSVQTGDAGSGLEKLTVVARPIAVRMLKESRGPKTMKKVSPSQFVQAECRRLGIPSVVQKSQKRGRVARDVKESGVKYGEKRGNQIPSSWTTFQRLADELGFVVFESAGKIYFGKPTWIVEQGKNDPVIVTWKTGLLENRTQWVPECSRSIDGEQKTVSLRLPLRRWPEVRPGKVLKLKGVPYFDEDLYLIQNVSYDLTGRADVINVTATIPVNPQKPEKWSGTEQYDLSGAMSLRALCEWAGFKGQNLDIAVAVAMAESGGDAYAVGDQHLADSKWGPSYGLFQIRSLRSPQNWSGVDKLRVASKLKDAMYNVEVAYKIFKQSGWGPWSTYTSGSYRKFLGNSKDYTVKNYTGTVGSSGSNWKGPTTNTKYKLGVQTKPWVERAANEVGHRHGIKIIYGYSNRPPSDHAYGLALDFMCKPDQGDAMAKYVRDNAGRLLVTYVIWKQRIWSVERASEGWRRMEDRGSVTANHYDHVHVSFSSTGPSSGGRSVV